MTDSRNTAIATKHQQISFASWRTYLYPFSVGEMPWWKEWTDCQCCYCCCCCCLLFWIAVAVAVVVLVCCQCCLLLLLLRSCCFMIFYLVWQVCFAIRYDLTRTIGRVMYHSIRYQQSSLLLLHAHVSGYLIWSIYKYLTIDKIY